MTTLRREGFTRELPDDAIARFFALSFALQEMRRTTRDLARDVEITAVASETMWEQGRMDAKSDQYQ